jgi:alkylation response protein AidB-like acyl-CoA dehydrogenase
LPGAQRREAFGKRLVEHQALRHKLVDLVRQIQAGYAWLDHCIWRLQRGDAAVAEIAMLKVQATRTLELCARDAMHVLAGEAYAGTTRVERIYREARHLRYRRRHRGDPERPRCTPARLLNRNLTHTQRGIQACHR